MNVGMQDFVGSMGICAWLDARFLVKSKGGTNCMFLNWIL
jgi:hypothetical protein